MLLGEKRRRPASRAGGGFLAPALIALVGVALCPSAARAVAPTVGFAWSSQVLSTTARLSAEINPNGVGTTYHFDYIRKAAFEANVDASKDGFSGATRIPTAGDANVGSGSSFVTVAQLPFGLSPDTAYRYRVVATNGAVVTGETREFVTRPTSSDILADGRGWEMVSPVDKNGGQVAMPGAIAAGGVQQAGADGQAVTYGSEASFAGGSGAPPASQYVATRTSSGWTTENITAPIFSGTYHAMDDGVPYRIFSGDLTRAILFNGDHCRGEGDECAVANPPLAGTDAPAGYQNYYLREGPGFGALLGNANAGFLTISPARFDASYAGASPNLRHPVLSTCAALTASASEVKVGEGCDPAEANLYLYSQGSGLSLVNLLPGDTTGTPGAALAAQAAAVSEDGSRVYFALEGNLYLREASQTKLVGEEATFQTASVDGSVAFYTTADEHLHRYSAPGAGASTDLTPAGAVAGVLGASASGDTVYYQDATGLERWHSAATTTVAAGPGAAEESDWPPTPGTSRVSADGTKLLFLSTESLTGYDNVDLNTHEADPEVFLYDGSDLTCVSCNPTLGRPAGPSSIPGAVSNGSTAAYKPRVLSLDGRRVFFDSRDALALADTDNAFDAYEWEAQGKGSCNKSGGCISLVSDGRKGGGGRFIDASADGSDAFFVTEGSLVPSDPGAADLYDARIGGGFAETVLPIACKGDACQTLPSPPADPTLTTLLSGPGNPPVRFPGSKKCPKDRRAVKRKGRVRCVKSGHGGKDEHHKRGRAR
jgi:hypothetical protein